MIGGKVSQKNRLRRKTSFIWRKFFLYFFT